MKTNAEILMLIIKKIEEHTTEVKGASENLEEMRINMKFDKPSIVEAGKIMVLKGKVDFHRSAILTLNDLKLEIEK